MEQQRHDAPELVTIHEFGNMAEALLAQGFLQSEGIDSFLADLTTVRQAWQVSHGTRLQVSADDAEQAIALLETAAPIKSDG
jgi:hypothetical protein